VACALGPFIQKEHAVVRQRHFAGHRHLAPADQPRIRDGVVGARKGRVVTKAVRPPVRPATRWMRGLEGFGQDPHRGYPRPIGLTCQYLGTGPGDRPPFKPAIRPPVGPQSCGTADRSAVPQICEPAPCLYGIL
jgi:hypothetical protein